MTAKRRIAFLLGAGFSSPAGMPATQEITDNVISGDGVFRHSDGKFYLTQDNHPLHEDVEGPDRMTDDEAWLHLATECAGYVKAVIDDYYRDQARQTNYEDIHEYCEQLKYALSGEFKNPALAPAIRDFSRWSASLFGRVAKSQRDLDCDTTRLLEETCHYVTDVVWRVLSAEIDCTDYLRFLKELEGSDRVGRMDVFTLNHDRVLESYLESAHLEYADGFDKSSCDMRSWDGAALTNGSDRLTVLRIHGSIDWFLKESAPQLPSTPRLVKIRGSMRGYGNQLLQGLMGRPMLLVGTHNKMRKYLVDVYAQMFCYMVQSLQECSRLVCIGYSFGDKGINYRIIDFLEHSKQARLIIVHPRPDEFRRRARRAFPAWWAGWEESRRVVFIPKGVEELKDKELLSEILWE